jgi:hypothetical protein
MFGRIHKAKIKGGDQQKDKKYEVRWTLTGFQSSKYIHRLTLSQVQRGIENYEIITRKRLNKATWEHICNVQENDELGVNASLDDYVILDSIPGEFAMPQALPDNLKLIEDIKTLDFQPSRRMQAPKDLYTHDDGTYETKLKKEMIQHFETASSSFFAYLPLAFWKIVVEQTNMKAKETKCAAITLDELIKFLGILFYMTLNVKGEYSNYWGDQVESKILGVDHPGLESVMAKKRFQHIRKYLCFRYDVSPAQLKKDPAARIRPLINMLKSTTSNYVHLGRNVAVDESSIACRSKFGRHLIVFNSSKPTGKYHFKIYVCCCSTS